MIENDSTDDRDTDVLENVIVSACQCSKFLFRKLQPYLVVRLQLYHRKTRRELTRQRLFGQPRLRPSSVDRATSVLGTALICHEHLDKLSAEATCGPTAA